MESLEMAVEEQLMDMFSMPDLQGRVDSSGLSKYEYRQGLIDALKNKKIRAGKTVFETLNNYESHIRGHKRREWVEDKINRIVWGGIGVMVTAPINYVISLPLLHQIQKSSLAIKEEIGIFAVFSLAAFIIEKRALTGLGNYLEKMPTGERKGMKKKDYLKLLGGYILSEFPPTRKRGKEIIDYYSYNPETENKQEEERTKSYSEIINNMQKRPHPKKQEEAIQAIR